MLHHRLQRAKNTDKTDDIWQLAEKYGPVYTVYMGMERVVVLCGYDMVRSALNDHGELFSARGHLPILKRMSLGGHGVIYSNGERWKQLRRFSLMTMRDFGVGKKNIEQRIQEEAYFLTAELRKTNGQPQDPKFYFSRTVSNVICSVVFGKRFEYENENFLRLLNLICIMFINANSFWGQMYNVYPKLMEKLPGPHNKFFKAVDQVQEFIAERIKMHEETLDPTSPRDFIDSFLIKMEQEKDKPNTHFDMDALVNTTFDMFVAGTETVSITLCYGLLILLKHPDVEERIHQELDQVIGRNRAPCIEDRSRMPYTDAVIHEIQRFIDLIPLGIPHKVTQDIEFKDYFIPKDTTIYPVLSSVLQDPKLFKYPHEFKPSHFLDSDGKFCKNDGFVPFSSGKRICLGEGLARMELFLVFTTILQNFTLRSMVATEEIDLSPETSGFGNCPHPYQLCFIAR
ncbi:cytochrome P450 2G1-like isoform X2 [Pelobates fuscus]|uniref:cytochrome P450 2G1-like isoform X2 n=1 Tax=Pelobates fuscus TaxID=191477 RepID=UPI002FE48B6B